MTTTRETALSALQALLVLTFGDGTDEDLTPAGKFWRDPEKSVDASVSGIVVMRDGDPGQPLITISPLQYEWEHPVELELSAVGTGRTAILDGLIGALDAALSAHRTLSGAVVDARIIEAPVVTEESQDGVEAVRYAAVRVRLEYVSTSPAG